MENTGLKERLYEEIKQQKESKASFVVLVSRLLDSQRQVHIFHLQTKSFAEHKALQDYYDAIGDIVDSLVESFQGKYGIITGWKSFSTEDYQSTEQVINYFKTISNEIKSVYEIVKDSYIQNQLDEIEQLINSTLYKLRFLK
jgi:HD superfamily phosphodiesterase